MSLPESIMFNRPYALLSGATLPPDLKLPQTKAAEPKRIFTFCLIVFYFSLYSLVLPKVPDSRLRTYFLCPWLT